MSPESAPALQARQDEQLGQSVQARTGARRRQATQLEIIDATHRLILAGEPFTGLSMDRIAKEAGMSRATLYLHFQDKNDILARLAHQLIEHRFALGADLLAEPEIGRDGFELVVARLVDRWAADAPLVDAIMLLAEQDEAIRSTWTDAIHAIGDMGADLMRRRWADAPGSYPDPQTIGRSLAWMFERSTRQLLRGETTRDQLVSAMTEIVWRVFDHQP